MAANLRAFGWKVRGSASSDSEPKPNPRPTDPRTPLTSDLNRAALDPNPSILEPPHGPYLKPPRSYNNRTSNPHKPETSTLPNPTQTTNFDTAQTSNPRKSTNLDPAQIHKPWRRPNPRTSNHPPLSRAAAELSVGRMARRSSTNSTTPLALASMGARRVWSLSLQILRTSERSSAIEDLAQLLLLLRF